MPPEPGQGGAEAHRRALESLYSAAPVNRLFPSKLEITGEGSAQIRCDLTDDVYHAGGAVHGSAYFKLLDDAAFYAANSLVTDRFLLTTAFNLYFTRPLKHGPAIAEGRWISGRRRVFVAEARLLDASGEEVARGTGTFMRSQIVLSSLPGYAA